MPNVLKSWEKSKRNVMPLWQLYEITSDPDFCGTLEIQSMFEHLNDVIFIENITNLILEFIPAIHARFDEVAHHVQLLMPVSFTFSNICLNATSRHDETRCCATGVNKHTDLDVACTACQEHIPVYNEVCRACHYVPCMLENYKKHSMHCPALFSLFSRALLKVCYTIRPYVCKQCWRAVSAPTTNKRQCVYAFNHGFCSTIYNGDNEVGATNVIGDKNGDFANLLQDGICTVTRLEVTVEFCIGVGTTFISPQWIVTDFQK